MKIFHRHLLYAILEDWRNSGRLSGALESVFFDYVYAVNMGLCHSIVAVICEFNQSCSCCLLLF